MARARNYKHLKINRMIDEIDLQEITWRDCYQGMALSAVIFGLIFTYLQV